MPTARPALALLAALGLAPLAAGATAFPPVAPPLPESGRTIVNVSTVAQLQSALNNLHSNTCIMVAPGTYHLTTTPYVAGPVSNVAVRGSTGNRDDIKIIGDGQSVAGVAFCLWFGNVQNITIADLSVGSVQDHPIKLDGDSGCDDVMIHNCRLFDAGQQFVKGTTNAYHVGVDRGVVEYCLFEYTVAGPDDGYTNGIDIHGGDSWRIHHNVFRNMESAAGKTPPGPTILMWNGSRNTITEDNVFINCYRAIAYGLGPQSGGVDHSGGIIRNNFIYRSASAAGDVAIGAWSSPNTKILHNTVLELDGYPNAIEYRFSDTTGVVIKNNLLNHAISARDGASATVASNLLSASSGLFVAPASGDLHLLSSASAAIDKVAVLGDCGDDFDNGARPQGALADYGADEYLAVGGTTTGGTTTGGTTTGGTTTGGTTTSGTTTSGSTTSGSGSGGSSTGGSATSGGTPSPISHGGGSGGGSSGCGLGGLAGLLVGALALVRRRR